MDESQMIGGPPPARHPINTSPKEYEEFIGPIRHFLEGTIARLPSHEGGEDVLRLILKAMGDTDRSIRFILVSSKRKERDEDAYLGTHYDAVFLARPQVEAALIGLLMLHDPAQYLPKYNQWGWAAKAQQVHYTHLRVGNTKEGEEWYAGASESLARLANDVGLSPDQAAAVEKSIVGVKLSRLEKSLLPRFPMPTEIVKSQLLAGSELQGLADLLWRQWKFLCDSTHVGIMSLMMRAFLRGDAAEIPKERRDQLVQDEILSQSVVPSAVSITALCTAVYRVRFRNNDRLLRLCSDAWADLAERTEVGGIIWDGWAKRVLGVLCD